MIKMAKNACIHIQTISPIFQCTVGATRQNALLNQLIKIKLKYDSYLTDVFIMPALGRKQIAVVVHRECTA